jgi:alpha-L-arabinofuranosidase
MKISNILVLSTLLFLCSCKKEASTELAQSAKINTNTGASFNAQATVAENYTGPIYGFNQNWSFLPSFTNQRMLNNIKALTPKIIRYPGGTVTHSWDWRKGVPTTRKTDPHPLSDLKILQDKTNAKIVFVLDIVNSTLADQLTMLKTAKNLGINVEYIEMGNELYAQEDNYEQVFPTGTAYADMVKIWVPQLRSNFPNAKIAALLFARPVNVNFNSRGFYWNEKVVAGLSNVIDAFTYHIYIGETIDFKTTASNFRSVVAKANTRNKPLWITEYGNMHPKTDTDYLGELVKLANFVESFPNVTIALSHLIVGSDKNKLSPDGNTLTPEGDIFKARFNARN